MDFGTLLHMAKKNNENKKESSYYSTKYAPPKKESKEKKLSDNIQKFLKKKEQEERERERKEKEKVNKLLSMRDEKSKNKIRKMLKVTKSANKSVLDDCQSSNTLQGSEQPDQDDYGYVSTEANAFYQKYIEKVKDVKEDKGFAPSRPNSLTDLRGTKERVKAAITREIEEKNGPRHRTSHKSSENTNAKSCSSSLETSNNILGSRSSSTKTLYDPVAERKEEERRKREEDQKRAKQRKPQPPPLDFQALLKLAEKKQHEPIELPVEVKKPKEPERLLTLKEKRELEERKRAKEARERREKEPQRVVENSSRERDRDRKDIDSSRERDRDRKDIAPSSSRMDPNGRIPKLGQPTKPTAVSKNVSNASVAKTVIPTKPTSQTETTFKKPTSQATTLSYNSPYSSGRTAQVPAKPSSSTSSTLNMKKTSAISSSSSSTVTSAKKPIDGPCRDSKSIKTRPFPPPDIRRMDNRQSNFKTQALKRRILDDDDEDEYDSEMDDFIDDGDEEADVSSHIKAIFGYDRSRYRDQDFDDRQMESNFAQVQREEFISKKIGLQEDLEDMRMEALEKKRKMGKKKKVQ